MAETYGVEVIPHSWGTGIAIHAAMHLIGMFSKEYTVQPRTRAIITRP